MSVPSTSQLCGQEASSVRGQFILPQGSAEQEDTKVLEQQLGASWDVLGHLRDAAHLNLHKIGLDPVCKGWSVTPSALLVT